MVTTLGIVGPDPDSVATGGGGGVEGSIMQDGTGLSKEKISCVQPLYLVETYFVDLSKTWKDEKRATKTSGRGSRNATSKTVADRRK